MWLGYHPANSSSQVWYQRDPPYLMYKTPAGIIADLISWRLLIILCFTLTAPTHLLQGTIPVTRTVSKACDPAVSRITGASHILR